MHDVLVGVVSPSRTSSCARGRRRPRPELDRPRRRRARPPVDGPAREYVLQGVLADVRRDYDVYSTSLTARRASGCSPSTPSPPRRASIIPDALRDAQPPRRRPAARTRCVTSSGSSTRSCAILGILPTLYDGRSTHSREVLEDVGERYDLPVLMPADPQDRALRRGTRSGPIDPGHGSHLQGRQGLPRGRRLDPRHALRATRHGTRHGTRSRDSDGARAGSGIQ